MRSKRDNQRGARQQQPQNVVEKRPYLAIQVSGAGLLIPLGEVSEILGYDAVAELPGAAEQVRGAVHLRGRVVPVVDVARNLRRPAVALSRRTSVVMLELSDPAKGSFAVGILCDGLASLLELEARQIEPPPALQGSAPATLRGIYANAGVNLALLDFALLLKDVALQDSPLIAPNDDPIWAFLPPPL
jgi:purine-binding chemotaxis protein CheW